MSTLRPGTDREEEESADWTLPPVMKVLPHATVPGTDRDAVVVRFGNGARLRYAEAGPDAGLLSGGCLSGVWQTRTSA